MPVIVTNASDGTRWQIPGKLVLYSESNQVYYYVALFFVDWTTSYEVRYNAPLSNDDARGGPIPIYGIGLDNLSPLFNEPMQILNSISI